MATALAVPVNPRSKGPEDSILVSAKGDWGIANSDVSATAQTSANLIRPGGVTASNIVPLKLGPRVTRALIRIRYGAAGTVTTSPILRLIAAWGAGLCDTSLPDDGTVRYMALATAQSVTCVAATDMRDATYSYSAPISLTATDMLGADYLIVFVETAASISGATPVAEVLLIN